MSPVLLLGTRADTAPLRECGKCHRTVETAGGVDAGPARWICASCWKAKRFSATAAERHAGRRAGR